MKRAVLPLALAAFLIPAGAAAQDGDGWWDPLSAELARTATGPTPAYVCDLFPGIPACRSDERVRRESRRDGDRRWKDRRGNGPPFCQSGRGHPVHGTSWCREKGWHSGSWRDVSWGDVIFGRGAPRRGDDALERGGLLDVLGEVVVERLERQARTANGGPLRGRFVERHGRVLQVRSGGLPLAELLDVDGDGVVDRMLVFSDR